MTSNTSPNAPANSSISTALAPTIDALPRDAARPAQTRFTRALQAAFLRRLADSGEVRIAARTLSVSHQTVYRMRRACRVFASGWDAALVIARERAEELLASRAMHGVEEEVYYHGEVVATRRRYDARLLLAHLARLDRKAERADVAGLAHNFDAVIAAFESQGLEGQGPQGQGPEGQGPTAHAPESHEPEDQGPQTVSEPSPTQARDDQEQALDRTPVTLPGGEDKTSPGPCNRRSMSQPEAQGVGSNELETEELEAHEPEASPELEQRLQAMEAARPDEALTLRELAQSWPLGGDVSEDAAGNASDAAPLDPPDAGAIEAAQLAAFEAGEAQWWRVTRERAGGSARDDVELHTRVPAAHHAELARGAA